MRFLLSSLIVLSVFTTSAQAQHRKARIAARKEPIQLYDSQLEPGTGNIISVGYNVTNGAQHPLLLKTDRHGNRIWSRLLAQFNSMAGFKVRIAANGDYIVVSGPSVRFFRSDSAGNVLASVACSFMTQSNHTVTGITELPNGNIVLCGHNDFEAQSSSSGYRDGYLTFLGPLGTVIKTIEFTRPSIGVAINYQFYDVAAHNNRLVVVGTYNSGGMTLITNLDGSNPLMRSTDGSGMVGSVSYGPVGFREVRSVGGNLYIGGVMGTGSFPPVVILGRVDTTSMTFNGTGIVAPLGNSAAHPRFAFRDTGTSWFAFQPFAPVPGYPTVYDAIIGRIDQGVVTYTGNLHEDSSLQIGGFQAAGDTLFLSGGTRHRGIQEGYFLRLQTADTTALCGLSSHAVNASPVSLGTIVVGAAIIEQSTSYNPTGTLINDTAYEMHICGAAPCRPVKAYAHSQTPTTICNGDTAKLKATHNYSTDWYRNGQLVATETDRFLTTQAGSYVAVANNGLCYDTAAAIVISVRPPVAPVLSQSGDSMLAPSYFTRYQWVDKFGADMPGDTAWWIKPLATDSFRVRVTDTNGCRGISDLYFFEKPTGTAAFATPDGIRLYPNPTTGSFVITAANVPVTLRLHNLQGQVIWQVVQHAASTQYSTATLGLRPGVYMLSCAANGMTHHRRLIVQ